MRSLEEVRPLYFLPDDPLAEEVLIPGFKVADTVDCMVGFFSSAVLASLAPGLATYIARSDKTFRLIVSPLLTAEDQKAIGDGIKSAEQLADTLLKELIVTEDLLQRHTLKSLSWLLQAGRLEIKVALMKGALFHPKVWLFEASDDVVAVHGSSNVTLAGIQKNVEQIALSRSWLDPTQRYITDKLRYEFARLWRGKSDNCIVLALPEAVRHHLLRNYSSRTRPTEDDLRALYRRAAESVDGLDRSELMRVEPKQRTFGIPESLRYEDGPFAHQGTAVNAWCAAGYRGILEMATGSGKTITSMIGAFRLYQQHQPLLIVVAAPYLPLVEQWCDELLPFGLDPVNLTTAGPTNRARILQRLKRRLRSGLSTAEVVVVSHDTLCTPEFRAVVEAFNCQRLLIADEAHNLGRASFVDDPPTFFEHRLALSATPIRQYDEEGTAGLFEFFGDVVFRFTLEEAITAGCLVQYDYYVHPVHLTETEMDQWRDLTDKIKANAWRSDDGKPDEHLARLFRDRRALLETACGKISKLAVLLRSEDRANLRHTLIYTSDKGPKQLQEVNSLLRENNLLFHQLTATETSHREQAKQILGSFQAGDLQVLTAKRVLDEGVNVPQICKAFILASTTVERQWIQRRGRLLRTCRAIGKTHSVIHDLVALPPDMDKKLDPDARDLVRSELRRVQKFAKLARNYGQSDGPLSTIHTMVSAAYL